MVTSLEILLYWVTSLYFENDQWSLPDIGFWTVPISWISMFFQKWVNGRGLRGRNFRGQVFKQSVIHHRLLNFNFPHPTKNFWIFRILGNLLILINVRFPRPEINLERRNDFKITFKYENRINDSPKWYELLCRSLTFQNTWHQRVELEPTFQFSKTRISKCSTNSWFHQYSIYVYVVKMILAVHQCCRQIIRCRHFQSLSPTSLLALWALFQKSIVYRSWFNLWFHLENQLDWIHFFWRTFQLFQLNIYQNQNHISTFSTEISFPIYS